MTRYVIAAVMAGALVQSAAAQPIPGTPPAPGAQIVPGSTVPPPPPPALFQPDVYIPPGTPVGPAIPFHKSTGVVVGAYGYYPFDTGDWILGGTDGLARAKGSFTMVYPTINPAVMAAPCNDASACKRGCFRR